MSKERFVTKYLCVSVNDGKTIKKRLTFAVGPSKAAKIAGRLRRLDTGMIYEDWDGWKKTDKASVYHGGQLVAVFGGEAPGNAFLTEEGKRLPRQALQPLKRAVKSWNQSVLAYQMRHLTPKTWKSLCTARPVA